MTVRQVHAGKSAQRRVAWTVLWVVSALALGAGVVADLVYGDGDHLVAVVVSGLCVVGVAAGFMASSSWGSDGSHDVPFASKDGFNGGGWTGL
jgi:hypothetical protein